MIDSLAAQGVRFDAAYSASSWTVPSAVTLLTGLHPASHGVEHGMLGAGKGIRAAALEGQEVIAEEIATLAELLRDAGWATFGVTANGHLDARFGFAQGFDHYRGVEFAGLERVEAALGELRESIAAADPFFLWVHLLDPHAPYTPRVEWIRAQSPDFRGIPGQLRAVVVAQHYFDRGVTSTRHPGFPFVSLLYDGEVAHTDAAIGRILETAGVTEDDLVVVTADHGEEFLEHGRFGHGYTLHDESIRVPLVLRLPGAEHAGRVVAEPVGAVDVLPTLLDALDLPVPETLPGRSAMPLVRGEADPRDVVTQLARFEPLRAETIRRGRWKLLRHHERGSDALYDLESDPTEQRDLAASEPEVARELGAALDAALAAQRAARIEPGRAPISDAELEELRALGYVEESP